MTTRRDLDLDLLALIRNGRAVLLELEEACEVRVPHASASGLRLGDLAEGGEAEWVSWALRRPAGYWPTEFERALRLVAAARFPHLSVTDDERREAA